MTDWRAIGYGFVVMLIAGVFVVGLFITFVFVVGLFITFVFVVGLFITFVFVVDSALAGAIGGVVGE